MLSDYDKIWTKFCFLDETGVLSGQKEQYFTVGILKMSQPYYLQSKLFYERSKIRFYDEIKFNKLSKNNVNFSKTAIDALFNTRSISFYSYSINTKSDYFLNQCHVETSFRLFLIKLIPFHLIYKMTNH